MRVKELKLYTFDELSEKAKEKAKDWYRGNDNGLDYEWWDASYESFQDAARYLGITIDTKTVRSVGSYTKEGKWDGNKQNSREEDCIYFSGFSSQGDGACFYGRWDASKMKPLKELKADFGTAEELYRIHGKLWAFKKQYPDAYCTSTKSSCHYSHERSTNLEAVLGEEIDYNEATHKPLEECLVDFMKWMYRQLEAEYDYLTSDEAITETIRSNEYEFTEDGKRA